MVDSGLTEKELLHIFGEDKTILVTGTKGSGKTNLAGVIMFLLINLGFKIWTNINFFKETNWDDAKKYGKLSHNVRYIPPHSNITTIKKLSIALKGMIVSGVVGKALIVDEAGIHAPSDRATSRETKVIKDLNKVIRHFETCFILITQVKGSVPPDLREKDVDFHFRVKKSGRYYEVEIGVRDVEVNDETGEEYITFPTRKTFMIPLSKYPIDGKFPTGFDIDIDLKEMLDLLSEAEDSIEIMHRGVGEGIIDGMIQKMEDQIGYLSTGQYEKKYNMSINTIKKHCKDGRLTYYITSGGRYKVLDQPPVFEKETEKEKMNHK